LNTNFLVFSSLKKYDQSFQSKKFLDLIFDDSIILWTKALKLFVLKISKVWDISKAVKIVKQTELWIWRERDTEIGMDTEYTQKYIHYWVLTKQNIATQHNVYKRWKWTEGWFARMIISLTYVVGGPLLLYQTYSGLALIRYSLQNWINY